MSVIALREAVFTALNGNVSYNSANVPVFSGYAETTDSLYIVLESATNNPAKNNKAKFYTSAVLNIEVVHTQDRAVSYKTVDDVFNIVKGVLLPAPWTAGFTLASPYKAKNPQIVFEDHLLEQTLEKIVRKIFRLQVEIEQDQFF